MRRKLIEQVKRVVIKVGSGVLTETDGLNTTVIGDLTEGITYLKDKKKVEVILVSSGAIASGLKKIGFKKKPQSISHQQAMAAIGQSTLMMAYERAFSFQDKKVAQILITRDDLNNRKRYLNARNTIFTLLAWNVIPIINENDTVVVDEIKFGDNDNLSAMITNLTDADLFVNLTNIDGLYNKDPRKHNDAELVNIVRKIDSSIARYADSVPGFYSRGGMTSKINAARKVAIAGIPTIIANGLKPHILQRIFDYEEEGTVFLPHVSTLNKRKHWIAFAKHPKGEIFVDQGAEKALVENNKSLLPSGITSVNGNFNIGDAVMVLNESRQEIGVGMVNYNSANIKKIKGLNSSEIENQLGFHHDDEVIHKDNLVITFNMEEGDDK